jgi:hypothetical protein
MPPTDSASRSRSCNATLVPEPDHRFNLNTRVISDAVLSLPTNRLISSGLMGQYGRCPTKGAGMDEVGFNFLADAAAAALVESSRPRFWDDDDDEEEEEEEVCGMLVGTYRDVSAGGGDIDSADGANGEVGAEASSGTATTAGAVSYGGQTAPTTIKKNNKALIEEQPIVN